MQCMLVRNITVTLCFLVRVLPFSQIFHKGGLKLVADFTKMRLPITRCQVRHNSLSGQHLHEFAWECNSKYRIFQALVKP